MIVFAFFFYLVVLVVTARLYQDAFSSLIEPINNYLKTVPIPSITSIFDNTFHYLDILTSSITTSQYRHQCIQHVLNVFAYYLTHFYAEKEIELFNESLFKLEEHQVSITILSVRLSQS